MVGTCTEPEATSLLGAIHLDDHNFGQQMPIATCSASAALAKIMPTAGLKFAHPVSPQLCAIGCKLAGQHVAGP